MATFVQNDKGNCRLCKEPDTKDNMVACDECDRWFHLQCAMLDHSPEAEERWICIKCQAIEDKMAKLEIKVKSEIKDKKDVQQGTEQGNNSNNEQPWIVYLKRQALQQLPKFDGSSRDWPSFKNIFEATTITGEFTDIENLNRLSQVLEGKAAKSVRQLMISADNVPRIMERLEENFGRSEFVYKELLHDLTRVKKTSKTAISEISDALENMVNNLDQIHGKYYLYDHRLIEETVQKLPYSLQIRWTEVCQENHNPPTLKDLNKWLQPHARTQRLMNVSNVNEKRDFRVNVHEKKSGRVSTHKNTQPAVRLQCPYCNESHKMRYCEKFKELDISKRNDVIMQSRLCLCCLEGKHFAKFCPTKRTCGIDNCERYHNRLLHQAKPVGEGNAEGTTNHHQSTRTDIYYQVIPVTIKSGEKSIETHAFLDAGSSLTLLDEHLANQLELKGNPEPLCLKWTQNITRNETTSRRVQLWISGSSKKSYALKGVRTVKNLQLPTQTLMIDELSAEYKYLQKLPIQGYRNVQPKILIGLNHSQLLTPVERRLGGEGKPTALRTKLGWLVFGNISKTVESGVMMLHEEEIQLNTQLQNYFAIEDFGVKVPENLPESKELQQAKKTINETMKYRNGRYEIGLLYRNDEFQYPDSYNYALQRLCKLEKQLRESSELKEWTINTFKEYEEKGYIRKLTPKELEEPNARVFYLPHFVTVNKNKTPPKPRIVFDAKAKVQGVSFNSALLSGPDQTTSLYGMLLRFRELAIAVCGDIKEMFLQVLIRMLDQHAQRFLWRSCENREPDIYVVQVMTFGSTCSPACAQAVKNFNAERYSEKFPEAVKAIVKQHYVDDYVDSFATAEEAKQRIKEVTEIHDNAGFYLRNFVSNDYETIMDIPSERRQHSNIRPIKDKELDDIGKVLGIFWNTDEDTIGFKVNLEKLPKEVRLGKRRPTKSEVLSFLMSVYDPLGLIANITIHGKILMQELHKATSDWKITIPENLSNQWKEWIETIQMVKHITIPRCMTDGSASPVRLHTFVDASEQAYAACVYIQTETTIKLVTAKSKVAPIKPLSIPRLELQAAVLGTRLVNTVKEEMRLQVLSSTMWSDSQTVLAWIGSEQRKYKQFISHRIGEILETTTIAQWRWVPTNENPADEATKKTNGTTKWYHGPEFLKLPEEKWPAIRTPTKTKEDLKEYIGLHAEENFNIVRENKYSEWWRLVKHLMVMRKYVQWISSTKNFSKNFSLDDKERMENLLYRKVQWEMYPNEMKDLVENSCLTKSSPLMKLNPFLDDEGVMRSGSRLNNESQRKMCVKIPIILPQKHRIVLLLVKSYHERYLHKNTRVVTDAIEQKFSIHNVTAVLGQVESACSSCIIRKARPSAPQMAALKECRTDPVTYPFIHTGVDYFGPFEVKVKRSIDKRWGVIFTCMQTRAVHLEMAESLSTDCFIRLLRDLQAQYGKITHLYSDNGTNFKGACNEMQRLIKEISDTMSSYEAAKMNIQWSFNPPGAPHFGGAWERLIGVIKSSLKEMLKSFQLRTPSPEELRSMLKQAQYIMNSRPLVTSSHDITVEVLTPFHFTILRASEYIPPYAPRSQELSDKTWKRVLNRADSFKELWEKRYLTSLRKRHKWTNKIEPLAVNDVVAIAEDGMLAGKWIKGIITKVHQSESGQVRSAEIRTTKGTLIRPAVKIAVLDINNSFDKKTTPQSTPLAEHRVHHHEEVRDHKGKSIDKTFPNWGKRQQIDEDKVKSIRDEITPKPNKVRRRSIQSSPSSLAKSIVIAASILSMTDALKIRPIEEDGLIFDHFGSCMIKRGIWRTNIQTNIIPSQDVLTIQNIRDMMNEATRGIDSYIGPVKTDHMIESIKHHCEDAIQSIQRSNRFKRSRGILGFLKDLFFGSDETEDEIRAMRIHEEEKIHQISKALAKINDKAIVSSKQFTNQIHMLRSAMTGLKHVNEERMHEHLYQMITETVLLAREMVDDVMNKYKKVRSYPLSIEEIRSTRRKIETNLPSGYALLDDVNAVRYDNQVINGSIVVTMWTTIVSRTVYDIFKVFAIPHTKNHTLMQVDNPLIAIGKRGEYFYPSKGLIKVNTTHFVTSDVQLHKDPDCVTAALLHTKSKETCITKQLQAPYVELIQLSETNTVLYYTDDPKVILVHCNNSVLPPLYESAIITMDPDCKIETKNTLLYAQIAGESKQSFTYFKPKTDINWPELSNTTNVNMETILTVDNAKPRSPYMYNINEDIYNDENSYEAKLLNHQRISMVSVILLAITVAFGLYYFGIRRCYQGRCNRRNPRASTSQPASQQTQQTEMFNRRRHFNQESNKIEENRA